MAEEKKTILNLIPELSQEFIDFLIELEFNVVNGENTIAENLSFILVDALSGDIEKVRADWSADRSGAKLVFLGEPQSYIKFFKNDGTVFIDPSHIKSNFGKEYLKRTFLQAYSVKTQDVFSGFNKHHHYKIDNHFRSGYFSDLLSIIAAECKFDVFSIRKTMMNTIYFFECLGKSNYCSAPYELEIFTSNDMMGFQIVASAKEFYKDFIVKSLEREDADLSFLADVFESSHILDIFYLSQGQKLGVTSYLFSNRPSVKTVAIQGAQFAKKLSSQSSLGNVFDSYIRNIEEKTDKLAEKQLPGKVFEIINLQSHGTLLEKNPGQILELASYAQQKLSEEGVPIEEHGVVEISKLVDVLSSHTNKPLIESLERGDLVDIRLLLEDPQLLKKFKDLLDKEAKLVGRDLSPDLEEVFNSRLESHVVDVLNESTLVKGSGEANVEDDSFLVEGQNKSSEEESFVVGGEKEDLGEDTTLVSGNGEGNTENESFVVRGEPEENSNDSFVVSGEAEKEEEPTFRISSDQVQEISKTIRSTLSNLNHEQKINRDELIRNIVKSCGDDTRGLDEDKLKEIAQRCVDDFITEQASNNIGENLIDLARVDKSLLKAKDLEIKGLEKKISELESNLKIYQDVDEISDRIEDSVEDILDYEEVEILSNLNNLDTEEIKAGQINAFAAENIKRTIEEAAVLRDRFNEIAKEKRRLELLNESQRTQYEAELSKTLRDKNLRQNLLTKTKELMAKQVSIKDRLIADEREKVNQMRKDLLHLQMSERKDNKELIDLQDQLESYKNRFQALTASVQKLKDAKEVTNDKPEMDISKFMEIKSKLEDALRSKDSEISELKKKILEQQQTDNSQEINISSEAQDERLQQEIEKREKLEAKNKQLIDQIESLEKQVVDGKATRSINQATESTVSVDEQEAKNYKDKNTELLKQLADFQLAVREKDQFMKDAEEKMQEVAGRVKELEHKLKIAQSIQKTQEKELKLKQKRAGASQNVGESQKVKFIEKNLEKAMDAKKKAESQLIDMKKVANQLKSENIKLKNELDGAKRKLGKSAA